MADDDDNKRAQPAVHFSSSVGPEPIPPHSSLYPALPSEDLQPAEGNASASSSSQPKGAPPRRLVHLPNIPKPNLPSMNLTNIKMPEMMNISSYITEVRPPAFLKEVYTLPIQMGGHINRGVQNVGSHVNKLIDRGDVYLHRPPPMPEFTNFSIFSALVSIGSAIFDHGSDIATAYVLYDEPDSHWWFWLTVTLIVVPTLFVNAFSLYWYCNEDHQSARNMFSWKAQYAKCWWIFRIVAHILLLGPILRYVDLLYYGIKSRQSKLQRVNIQGPYCPWPKQQAEIKKQGEYYNLLLHEERDISILELIHSFMQDAPQLILQIYILAKRPPESKTEHDYIVTVLVQSFSALTSLLSLSWSLVSYQKTLRYAMPDKPQLSVGGAASIFLWHTGQVMARVIALALFAKEFKVYVFILLGAHWALMTSWILGQRTNFCAREDGKRRPCEEFSYNVVVGWVFNFVMINVKAAATRLKYSLYYILMAAENTAMIVLWYLQPESYLHWYHLPALIGTCVSFVVGLFFMFVYYGKYHPDGKMPKKDQPAKLF